MARSANEATSGSSETAPLPPHVPIAIIGAGFSGIGMAIALAKEGYAPCEVLISSVAPTSEVGGTQTLSGVPMRCAVQPLFIFLCT